MTLEYELEQIALAVQDQAKQLAKIDKTLRQIQYAFTVKAICTDCDGTGHRLGRIHEDQCHTCQGEGWHFRPRTNS